MEHTSKVFVRGLFPEITPDGNEQRFTFHKEHEDTTLILANNWDIDTAHQINSSGSMSLEISCLPKESFKLTVEQGKEFALGQNATEDEMIYKRPSLYVSYCRPPDLIDNTTGETRTYNPLQLLSFGIYDNETNPLERYGILHCNVKVNMSEQRIYNLADPVEPTDAVTKQYVDNNINHSSNTELETLIIKSNEELIALLSQYNNDKMHNQLFHVVPLILPVSGSDHTIVGCNNNLQFLLYPNNSLTLTTTTFTVYRKRMLYNSFSQWDEFDLMQNSTFRIAVQSLINAGASVVKPYFTSDGDNFYCFLVNTSDVYDGDCFPGHSIKFENDDDFTASSFLMHISPNFVLQEIYPLYASNGQFAFFRIKTTTYGEGLLRYDRLNDSWALINMADRYVYNVFADISEPEPAFYAISSTAIYECTDGENWTTKIINGNTLSGSDYAKNGAISENGNIFLPNRSNGNMDFRYSRPRNNISSQTLLYTTPFNGITSITFLQFFYAGAHRIGFIGNYNSKYTLFLSKDEGLNWIPSYLFPSLSPNQICTVSRQPVTDFETIKAENSLNIPNSFTIILQSSATAYLIY